MEANPTKQPKLIVHLDINGTIMPADPIKSKHVDSMLNLHLSKQAFVRRSIDDDSEFVWWDGTPFHKGERPPLLPQFRYTCHIQEHYNEVIDASISVPKKEFVSLNDFNNVCDGLNCRNFTSRDSPGHVYESDLLDLLDALEWKHRSSCDPEVTKAFTLSVSGDRLMNLFVPSFLELLKYLHNEVRDFVIIIRTFGSDIPRLLPAFAMIAEGLHPDLPHAGYINPPMAYGRLSWTSPRSFNLEMVDAFSSETCFISGNSNIQSYFEHLPTGSVIMVNDDYDTWKQHDWKPEFGKPVFVDLEKISSVRHFLFDDNVNLNPDDSIACVWLREPSGRYKPYPHSKPEGLAMIGTVLLQATLYNSILDPNSFVAELKKADARYDTLKRRILNR